MRKSPPHGSLFQRGILAYALNAGKNGPGLSVGCVLSAGMGVRYENPPIVNSIGGLDHLFFIWAKDEFIFLKLL